MQSTQKLVIGWCLHLDLGRSALYFREQLLCFHLLIRLISQQGQCALRLSPEACQDAVIASVRPVIFELDLELTVIGIFIYVRHIDRQARVIRLKLLFYIVRQYEIVSIRFPKSRVLPGSREVMRLNEVP